MVQLLRLRQAGGHLQSIPDQGKTGVSTSPGKEQDLTAQSGESRLSDDINVTEGQFLGQRSASGGVDAVGAAQVAGHHAPDDNVDDLPS